MDNKKPATLSAESLKQYLLLAVIVLLIIVLGWQVLVFMPGVLGAITMYILMRERFFRLTVIKDWKKWVTASLFIAVAVVVFVLPIALCAQLMVPKFYAIIHDPARLDVLLDQLSGKLQNIAPRLKIDDEQVKAWGQNAAASVPGLLSETASALTNLVLAFFLLYFMLVDGRKMERKIQRFLPLREENIDDVWDATRVMVISNAIGIPVLALGQAVVAGISYWIFGVEAPLIWAIVTGIFSVLPVLGSAIVWLPLSLYLMVSNHLAEGIGLLVYSVVITASIDNVLRFTILKKLGDVHPVITVFGIMVGVPLFGFMGLIFGPLLISYLLLLIKIYRVEFSARNTRPAGQVPQLNPGKSGSTNSNDFLQRT